MSKYLLALTLSILLFSCKQEKKQLPENSSPQPRKLTTRDTNKIYRGLFVLGKNSRAFRDCADPERQYWVSDSTAQMEELYKTMFLNSPAFPYEYVYVEVRGFTSPSLDNVAEKGFDSTIIVKEILTFEQKNYQNTCIPYDFWGLGNLPDWSLQVSQKEGILAMKDYSENRVYLFEYFSPKVVNDEVFTYNSNNYATQTAILAVFKKERCTDGTTNNVYRYSVSIVINGKKYSGCAIKGMNE